MRAYVCACIPQNDLSAQTLWHTGVPVLVHWPCDHASIVAKGFGLLCVYVCSVCV